MHHSLRIVQRASLSLLLMATLVIAYLGVLRLDDSWLVAVTDRLAGRVHIALPDFAGIQNVQAKKQQFFSYMLPMVRRSNNLVLEERKALLTLQQQLQAQLSADRWPGQICRRYLKTGKDPAKDPCREVTLPLVNELLRRVDTVPASLVLAQSAKESGWGTSRFAREANNLFGVRCFSAGCGLTPRKRRQGQRHEVRLYDSIQDSISAYILTINTHPAYESLRGIRARTRAADGHPDGLLLAEGLLRYSTRGLAYVQEIQALIRSNNLQQYTLPKSA